MPVAVALVSEGVARARVTVTRVPTIMIRVAVTGMGTAFTVARVAVAATSVAVTVAAGPVIVTSAVGPVVVM